MIADDYVLWVVTDPLKYYQTLGAIDARAEERIDAAVYNATKNTISSMSQDDVIAARGAALTETITKESNSDIAGYGITILTAEIKALDLPDDNKTAVYERMISERQNIAASYTAKGESDAQMIKNETDKEVTSLVGVDVTTCNIRCRIRNVRQIIIVTNINFCRFVTSIIIHTCAVLA
jgi:membrane protease subunit HflC